MISNFWLITSNNVSIKPGAKLLTVETSTDSTHGYVEYLRGCGDGPSSVELSVRSLHCALAGVRTDSHTELWPEVRQIIAALFTRSHVLDSVFELGIRKRSYKVQMT